MHDISIITRLSRPTADLKAIYDSIHEQFQSFYWLVYVEKAALDIPPHLSELTSKDPRVVVNSDILRDGPADFHFSQSFNHALNTEYVKDSKWWYVCDDDNILHHRLRELIEESPSDIDLIINRINDRRGVHCIDNPKNLTVDRCVGGVDWANAVFSSKFFQEHIRSINTQTKSIDGDMVREYLRCGARVWYSDRVGGYYNHLQYYPNPRAVKVAFVTLDNRPELEWVKLTNKSKEEYCKAHGFDFIFKDKLYYTDKHPVWSKMPCMLDVMQQGYDYVVWLDADAIIANPRLDITGWFDYHDIYYSKDVYGLNFGVFALKNTPTAEAFLRDIEAGHDRFKNTSWREQDAASELLKGKYRDCCKEIPARVWNSYDDVYNHKTVNVYQDGDFILHVPAKGDHYRLDRFSQIVGKY